MPFTEDISLFFDIAEFASAAVIRRTDNTDLSVSVILNTPTRDMQFYDLSVEAEVPNVAVRSSDLVGVNARNSLTLNSITYEISKIHSDGIGITTLYLKKGVTAINAVAYGAVAVEYGGVAVNY